MMMKGVSSTSSVNAENVSWGFWWTFGWQIREAGILDVINLFFSNLFRCVSYILVYICHWFIGLKKILFWNENWRSVTQSLQKPLRKAIQLSPAEVAYRFAYIDSSWVKESKYNSNVMPTFDDILLHLRIYRASLSLTSYRTRSWTM